VKPQVLSFFGIRAVTLGLIVGAASALEIVIAFPVHILPYQGFVGIAVILLTKILDYESIKALSHGKGTFLYTNPPKNVIETGPYNYTRNPLYLTLFVDTFGIFLVYESAVYLVILIALIVGIHRIVVKREEPQLEKRFGDAYLNYKKRVPRWIPKIQRQSIT